MCCEPGLRARGSMVWQTYRARQEGEGRAGRGEAERRDLCLCCVCLDTLLLSAGHTSQHVRRRTRIEGRHLTDAHADHIFAGWWRLSTGHIRWRGASPVCARCAAARAWRSTGMPSGAPAPTFNTSLPAADSLSRFLFTVCETTYRRRRSQRTRGEQRRPSGKRGQTSIYIVKTPANPAYLDGEMSGAALS